MWIGDDDKLKLRQRFHRFWDARDTVAGVSLHEHRPHVVFLLNLISGHKNRIEPARQWDAGGLHHLLAVETRDEVIVIDLPNT
jgi:hypothetical protein